MFYITISNGLMKDGHRKRMGEAVWEFMWLIDKVTKIDDEGRGHVLGGRPILLNEIANDHGVDHETVSRNLIKLESQGYIIKRRTPRGIVIFIEKAKKGFHKSEMGFHKSETRNHTNVESNIRYKQRQYQRHQRGVVDNLGKRQGGAKSTHPKKPTFDGQPMSDKFGKWMVKGVDGEWRDFNGKKSEIVWK